MDGDVNANLLALRFNEDSEFECMKKLIAKGADCCAKDSWNYTPLMYAVKGSAPKAIKAVKFIINKNAATLNAKNYFQTTALELAGKLQNTKKNPILLFCLLGQPFGAAFWGSLLENLCSNPKYPLAFLVAVLD